MEICFNICSQTLSVLEKSWKFVSEKGYEPCFKPIAQEQKTFDAGLHYKKVITIDNNNNNNNSNNNIIIIANIKSFYYYYYE